MSQTALHLTARDFDAYAPEKATSKAYSLPRLEVKQRALAWARGVVQRLSELGIAVDVHGSDEHPSLRNKKRVEHQWVFFWRDPAARDELDRLLDRGRPIAAAIDDPSPYNRHAFLALKIDARAVEVCFAVHPEAEVDVDNLRARLASPGANELSEALRALPEQFLIGVGPDDAVAAGSASPETLRAVLERATAGSVPLWVGWSVARETAVEHSALLDEQLEDALIALAPIYRLVAWSRANDLITLERRLEGALQERARTHAEAEAQNQRWLADQAAARKRAVEEARARVEEAGPGRGVIPAARGSDRGWQSGPLGRRPTADTLFSQPPRLHPTPPGARPTPVEARPPPPASPPAPPPARPAAVAAMEGPGPARAEEVPAAEAKDAPAPSAPRPHAPAVVEKGARVRVLAGPFADKQGIVAEIDGRGGARVLLGLLATRVELSDLEPVVEGRERPSLQTSHRRPAPSVPRKAR